MSKILNIHTRQYLVGLVQKNSAQTIPNNTATNITNWTVVFDTKNWWDAANSRWIVQEDGTYNFSAGVGFVANSTSYRWIEIKKNGTRVFAGDGMKPAPSGVSVVTGDFPPIQAVAGDYFEVAVIQVTGSPLDTTTDATHNWFGFFKTAPKKI